MSLLDQWLDDLVDQDLVTFGELAEAEGHHPAILTEWGSVEVSWWTHKIGGLHMNDFIMAARTDELTDQ